jgi:ABC-type Fe3+/spermidine/putrescine transport system ATPase subunit
MEEKLIKGGEVISKAAQQEAALRKAEKELRERQMQEAALARELAEKEEANLQLEEHFSSLQEEVEVKTKKLKKLWGKFQQAQREVKEQEEEFAVSSGTSVCVNVWVSGSLSMCAVEVCCGFLYLSV